MAGALTPYKTRFAPSPTGALHLGHAYSALIGSRRAMNQGGQFLLRIEDIDKPRCKPTFEEAIFTDLRWLGLSWPSPVLRQSLRSLAYQTALNTLQMRGLTYQCACTRADIRAALSAPQEGSSPIGPEVLIYPGTCRNTGLSPDMAPTLRLNMTAALAGRKGVEFTETGENAGMHFVSAQELLDRIGDVVLARKDIGVSYHLAVVTDDGFQQISEVVRGLDLQPITALQVLLQEHLGLQTPLYHHHRLIRDAAGKRLAKRDDARALALLRDQGLSAHDVLDRLGLDHRV